MDRHKLVQELESTLGVAVGVVLSALIANLVGEWSAAPIAVIIITVSVILLRFLGGMIFVRIRVLRRILLGKQYVEGTWFDVMRKNGKPAEIGFSRISYTNSNIEFSGEDYDLAVDRCFPYRAVMVQMSWPTLKYVYTAIRSDTKEEKTTGYGHLVFQEERHGYPTKYAGKYFVLRGTDTVSFEGIKLDESKDRELIERLDDPGARKKALRELLKKYSN